MFITFEGLEGSGKSTQVGLLASRLKEKNISLVVTREPGGTRIGEHIRQITHGRENVDLTAVAESYLMAASRAQHVREIIRPALNDGNVVICDRFIDSSLAYQGYGRELGVETILNLNELAQDKLMPDVTILLDVSPPVGFSRRNHSDKIDRLDLQQPDFYQRVYQGYKKIAQKFKERYYVVDSSKPIESVSKIIWDRVKREKIPNNKSQVPNKIQ